VKGTVAFSVSFYKNGELDREAYIRRVVEVLDEADLLEAEEGLLLYITSREKIFVRSAKERHDEADSGAPPGASS